jgi:hypothetical protein
VGYLASLSTVHITVQPLGIWKVFQNKGAQGRQGLKFSGKAACTAFTGMAPTPTAIPQQTTQATAPVFPQRQGTTPFIQPATIKLLREEIEFSGMPNLAVTTTCLFKKEDCSCLQADKTPCCCQGCSRGFCQNSSHRQSP